MSTYPHSSALCAATLISLQRLRSAFVSLLSVRLLSLSILLFFQSPSPSLFRSIDLFSSSFSDSPSLFPCDLLYQLSSFAPVFSSLVFSLFSIRGTIVLLQGGHQQVSHLQTHFESLPGASKDNHVIAHFSSISYILLHCHPSVLQL